MKQVLTFCLLGLVIISVRGQSLSDFIGGTTKEEIQRIKSPDGHSVAILLHKEKHGPSLPPEPPKTQERWSQLTVQRDGKTIFDSGFENLNIYQSQPGDALDVIWSPDSSRLAYRHITSFRIVGSDGKVASYDVSKNDSAISSFKWIDNASLLIVSKQTEYPLDMHGKPYCYNGYIDRAKNIHIAHLQLTNGITERYQHSLGEPTFLFHSVWFCAEEISPNADRVAFSDGTNLCVYDDTVGKLIAQEVIPQKPTKPVFSPGEDEWIRKVDEKMAAEPAQLEGIWWQTNNKLLVGIGLLGKPTQSFYSFDLSSKAFVDETSSVLPLWKSLWETGNVRGVLPVDWYKTVIK